MGDQQLHPGYFRSDLGLDWIDLAPDRVRWRTLVSAVMNLRVP